MKKIHLIYCNVFDIDEMALGKFLQKGEKVDNPVLYMIDCLKNKNPHVKYYEFFCKHKTTKKLQKIINDINNEDLPEIGLLTDKKDLFEFFEGVIYITDFTDHFYDQKSKVIIDTNIKISNRLEGITWYKENYLFNHLPENYQIIEIFSLIKKFIKYNEIFNINIKSLIKGTNYKSVKEFKQLYDCINEDIKILIHYNIFTSRLGIVLKRLFDFNLNQNAKNIGKYLGAIFNTKSVSYRYKFDNKTIKSDLTDKSFRGYKIDKCYSGIISDIEIFNKLREHNVNEYILRNTFGTYKFFTMKELSKNTYIKKTSHRPLNILL